MVLLPSFAESYSGPEQGLSWPLLPALDAEIARISAACLRAQGPQGLWDGEDPVATTADMLLALGTPWNEASRVAIARAWDRLWDCAVRQDADTMLAESAHLAVLDAMTQSELIHYREGGLVIAAAVERLRSLQRDDGGWRFPDPTSKKEPSCALTSGKVLAILGRCGLIAGDPEIDACLDFLDREQEADSGWASPGVSPYRVTWEVLSGLRVIGMDERFAAFQRAAGWLQRSQTLLGAWGSDVHGGEPSMPETSWAILGLVEAHAGTDSPIISAVTWLLEQDLPGEPAPLAAMLRALRGVDAAISGQPWRLG